GAGHARTGARGGGGGGARGGGGGGTGGGRGGRASVARRQGREALFARGGGGSRGGRGRRGTLAGREPADNQQGHGQPRAAVAAHFDSRGAGGGVTAASSCGRSRTKALRARIWPQPAWRAS